MTKIEAEKIIDDKLLDFCTKKLPFLKKLYELPRQELKDQEKQTLSEIALSVIHDASELVPGVLKTCDVKYPQTIWGNIQPKLAPLNFKYIDWDSVQAYESAMHQNSARKQSQKSAESYQRKITNRDKEKVLRKNGRLLIPAGGLAVGSIALISLHIGPKTIWVVGLIVAAAIAGYVVFQNLFNQVEERESSSSIQPPKKDQPQESPVNLEDVIKSVSEENNDILVKWIKALKEITLNEWREAEKNDCR